jgi:hypothetical protein
MFKSILTAIVLTFTSATLASANNYGVVFDESTGVLTVHGTTTQNQVAKARYYFITKDVLVVSMHGRGGDYYAGLSLGNLISKEESLVIIPEGKECISACAFAAIGSDKITLNGSLLFHVPYTRAYGTNYTLQEISQEVGVVYVDMAAYLLRQGFSIHFAREILASTSPCKFIVVTDGESLLNSKGSLVKPNSYKRTTVDRCLSRPMR